MDRKAVVQRYASKSRNWPSFINSENESATKG